RSTLNTCLNLQRRLPSTPVVSSGPTRTDSGKNNGLFGTKPKRCEIPIFVNDSTNDPCATYAPNDIPKLTQCVVRSPILYPGVSHVTLRALYPAQTQSSKASDQQREGVH